MQYIKKEIVCWLLVVASVGSAFAQQQLTGRVLFEKDRLPIAGASVRILPSGKTTSTDDAGYFTIPIDIPGDDSISVSHVGYLMLSQSLQEYQASAPLLLTTDQSVLEEVEVNTGYYTIPKERAAGSFTHIDNEMLNRNTGSNILQRLEGMANGLQFDRAHLEGEDVDGTPSLRVRGVSTLYSDSRPLIVVDNFPFDGDLNAINPNDVESVTILKDASAASIWGARAGNGVIVITMKQGRYQQPVQVSFQSYVNFREKPDLHYSQNYLNPATVMQIQKELLERGVYTEAENVKIPLYAEWLIKRRDDLITQQELESAENSFRQSDIRSDAMRYLYRVANQQQYTLGIRGGEKAYRYYLAAGYDKDLANIIGNGNTRLSLSLQNAFRLSDRMELEGGIWYTKQETANNGIGFDGLGVINAYAPLVTPTGEAAPIVHNDQAIRYAYQELAESEGLLDWLYRPLDEQRYLDNTNTRDNIRVNLGASYRLPFGLQVKAVYQQAKSAAKSRSYYPEDSYYTHNIVNRFTQADGTRIVPTGGILAFGSPQESHMQAGRLQLNFQRRFVQRWDVTLLAGGEASHTEDENSVPFTFYGYNPSTGQGTPQHAFAMGQTYPTRPISSSRVPYDYTVPNKRVNRTLSYYANGALSLDNRYVLNGSVRWDGSNLLGVKTNQRGTALWSAGAAWEISKEPFYTLSNLDYLRLRTTYGAAGNINKSVGHYPVISRGYVSRYGGLDYANLVSPGNPNLQWEQVYTWNIGLDWRLAGGALGGTVEVFRKDAKHLLSNLIVDPTIGVNNNYLENYADMRTEGLDITVSSRLQLGPITWENTLLANYSGNKVTHLSMAQPDFLSGYFSGPVYLPGKSRDAVYAIPWYGLNPENGLPLIYQDNQVSNDYGAYYDGLQFSDLATAGLSVAPWYGSLRTGVSWRGLQVSALFTFKAGHVFRRRSISPGVEYNLLGEYSYHMDYYRRWQKPGDEQHTNVPARLDNYDAKINSLYTNSETLITPADNIRLQDINITYTLADRLTNKTGLSGISIYGAARNLGILWRKNRLGIDPDVPFASYPVPLQWTMGLRAQF